MAFMRVFAEQFDAYVVETTHGTEIVPADCIKHGSGTYPFAHQAAQFIEGTLLSEFAPDMVRGAWWGRLSAPGYLDCTEWDGPHVSEEKARAAVKAMFDVDDDGDIPDEGDDDAATDNAV